MICLAWFEGRAGAQTSHLLILQHHTSYLMDLSRGIESVALQDHLMFKNLNPKPINLFHIESTVRRRLKLALSVCVCVCVCKCSKSLVLITCFMLVYVGHAI